MIFRQGISNQRVLEKPNYPNNGMVILGFINSCRHFREAGLSNPAVPEQRGLITPPPEKS